MIVTRKRSGFFFILIIAANRNFYSARPRSVENRFRFRKLSCKCPWQQRIRLVAWRTRVYTHTCMDHGIKGKMRTWRIRSVPRMKRLPFVKTSSHGRDSDESSNPGHESAFVSFLYAWCERSLFIAILRLVSPRQLFNAFTATRVRH